jgi:predicted RNA-binding protein with PIN domain
MVCNFNFLPICYYILICFVYIVYYLQMARSAKICRNEYKNFENNKILVVIDGLFQYSVCCHKGMFRIRFTQRNV